MVCYSNRMKFTEEHLDLNLHSLKKFREKGFRQVSLIKGFDGLDYSIRSEDKIIILCGKGNGEITINRKKNPFTPGSMAVISKGLDINIKISGTDEEISLFILNKKNSRYTLLKEKNGLFPRMGNPSRIPDTLRHLLYDSSLDLPSRQKMVEDGADIILNLLEYKIQEITGNLKNDLNIRFEELWNRVSLNPGRRWSNLELADAFGASYSHLIKLCRDLYKTTPGKMVWNRKMLTAASLLVEDRQMSIQNVAENVGYSDPFAFSTAFKRKYGVSPREYRKSH